MVTQHVFEPAGQSHTRNASLASVITLTPTDPQADALVIQVETQAIRYTTDGTTPSATVGFKIPADGDDIIPIGRGGSVKIIEAVAGAVINYMWVKIRRADQ